MDEFLSMAEQRRHEYLVAERDKLFNEQFLKMMEEDLSDPVIVEARPLKKLRIVAFDVDGCLFDQYDQPRWPVIDILRGFSDLGWGVVVWSGSGVEYARRKVERLGLQAFVWISPKGIDTPDVAFDDQDVTLGKANIRI